MSLLNNWKLTWSRSALPATLSALCEKKTRTLSAKFAILVYTLLCSTCLPIAAVDDFAAVVRALNSKDLVWTYGPKLGWSVDTVETHDGIGSAASIGGAGSYSLETTVSVPGKLTFWWK